MATKKMVNSLDFQGTLLIKGLGAPVADNDAARKLYVDTGVDAAKSRANHTGSQTASTISDFDTAVRTNRLDQLAAPTAPLGLNNQRLTSVADPTSAQEAATKAYVDAQLAGVATGQVLKGAVRAAVGTNVNTAAPGATLDGLAAANGDVFLLTGQTTGSQNGPWVYNGAAAAMTRPANWDSNAEAVIGSYWIVREGTQADTFALLTNDTAVNLGTTSLSFVVRGTASAVTGYTATCPTVAAGATWTVTHNLGSTKVIAQLWRVGSPFDQVDVYIARPDANTLAVQPDIAFASGEYEIVVQKVA